MKTCTIIISLLISALSFSQSFIISDLTTLSDHLSFKNSYNNDTQYKNIDGTPYLSENFTNGEVILNDSLLYMDIPLRYNIYNDKIEFKNENEQVLEIDNSKQNGKYRFNNQIFISHNYFYEGQQKQGILELLVDGEIQLYKKHTVEFTNSTKAIGYQEAKPNRFTSCDCEYLIAKGKNNPELIKQNKKTIFEELKQYQINIEQYAKEEKLNPKSEKELIRIVSYCNN